MKPVGPGHIALLLLALLALYVLSRSTRQPQPGTPADNTPADDAPDVRAAGPQNMETPPEDWDIIDEQGDQSFPASDPPGNY